MLINDYGRIAVSMTVMLAFLGVLALVLTRSIADSTLSNNMLQVLGTLTAAVVYYWIGSSSGSTAKDRTIAARPPAAAPTPAAVAITPAPAPPAPNPGIIQP